jgi:hypothetical protein
VGNPRFPEDMVWSRKRGIFHTWVLTYRLWPRLRVWSMELGRWQSTQQWNLGTVGMTWTSWQTMGDFSMICNDVLVYRDACLVVFFKYVSCLMFHLFSRLKPSITRETTYIHIPSSKLT